MHTPRPPLDSALPAAGMTAVGEEAEGDEGLGLSETSKSSLSLNLSSPTAPPLCSLPSACRPMGAACLTMTSSS